MIYLIEQEQTPSLWMIVDAIGNMLVSFAWIHCNDLAVVAVHVFVLNEILFIRERENQL